MTKECELLVETARMKAFQTAAYTVEKSPTFHQYTDCIMDKLKVNKWYEQILKKTVLEGSENMPVEELHHKLDEVCLVTHSIFIGSIIDCINEQEFGNMFDHFLNTDDSKCEEEEDLVKDYCAKKFVVDKHLINNNIHSVKVNSIKLDVSNVDCDVILVEHEKEFYKKLEKKLEEKDDEKDLNGQKVSCASTKYQEGDLFHKMLALSALKHINISEEQKTSERKIFLDFMKNLTTTLVSCQDEPFDSIRLTKRTAAFRCF